MTGPQWFTSTVTRIEDHNERLRIISFDVHDPLFHFIPGQFCTFDLPLGDKRIHRWRSYSLASHPDQLPHCSIALSCHHEGKASQYFFREISIGTLLRFKAPEGTFILPKTGTHGVVFIVSGTGIVPVKSILIEWKKIGGPYPVHLIYGTRKESDILWPEFWSSLESLPFSADIVLSREPEWHGYKGHVHPVYLQYFRNHGIGWNVMLCGWKDMIDEAVPLLINNCGLPPQSIKYELYG